ncbi:MAG TPA: single-stranded-DNA-specific exonuclease RecJ [candidate division Zixibacteria bacterium]|nr:single-stranded-DNA-specific exonuclease RecJ [candidate division Zixibacteria bacterium]
MKWTLSEQASPRLSRELADELEIPRIISQILVNRGISTPKEMKSFFYPTLDDLLEPMAIPGMKEAIERIISALAQREKIVVFGDYDVDGITATALLYLVLNRFGADVEWYLPDRVEEGYGLSRGGIDDAVNKGVSLLISVDCGITGVEEVEYARSMGIDCVITDHHEPADKLPNAVALVDPKLGPEDSPSRELAGVGVAFKVAEALFNELHEDKETLFEHLDLVGLGTVADIVPLTGENRIFAKFGLRQLESTKKPGLKSLLQVTSLWGTELYSWNIVFVLAPRLNAVGRIGSPASAFKLLTTHDSMQASQMASILDQENKKRKKLDEHIFEKAVELVENTVDLENDRAIVIESGDWHVGVIGIVASRLVERYHRPVVLISTADGEGQGSARTIANFHLLNAIKDSSEHLEKFGGHKYAAGLCILPEKIEDFRRAFLRVAKERLTEEDLVPQLKIDAKIDIADIDMKLLDWLKLFSPYGPKNMRPVFAAVNVELLEPSRIVGKNHLRFRVRAGHRAIDAIAFGFGDMKHAIDNAIDPINIAFVIESNDYYGYPQIQLRIKDIFIGDLHL